MTLWAVVVDSRDGRRRVRQDCSWLSDQTDGLLLVGPGQWPRGFLPGRGAPPAEADLVVYGDTEAFAEAGRELLPDMLAVLDDADAAVVRAAPVTDALKAVHDGRVLGSVERSGLFTVRGPNLVRLSALQEATSAAADTERQEPVTLLLAAGRRVRIFGYHSTGVPHVEPVGHTRPSQ